MARITPTRGYRKVGDIGGLHFHQVSSKTAFMGPSYGQKTVDVHCSDNSVRCSMFCSMFRTTRTTPRTTRTTPRTTRTTARITRTTLRVVLVILGVVLVVLGVVLV